MGNRTTICSPASSEIHLWTTCVSNSPDNLIRCLDLNLSSEKIGNYSLTLFHFMSLDVMSCHVISFHFISFLFLQRHMQHMEVPGLGVELERQPKAYATAKATLDPSRICKLHCSLWQHQILNALSEARMEPTSSRTLCRVLNPRSLTQF